PRHGRRRLFRVEGGSNTGRQAEISLGGPGIPTAWICARDGGFRFSETRGDESFGGNDGDGLVHVRADLFIRLRKAPARTTHSVGQSGMAFDSRGYVRNHAVDDDSNFSGNAALVCVRLFPIGNGPAGDRGPILFPRIVF